MKDEVYYGTVKYYNPTRGFGFLRADSGAEYFYHASGLKNGFVPAEGEKVSFQLGSNLKGPLALQVSKKIE